jgi:arsenate reductase
MVSCALPRIDHACSATLAATVPMTAHLTLYGIANCDTVKNARTWLLEHGIDFTFHDFKKQGLERATAQAWLKEADWQTLVNRKGTTWRKLEDAQKEAVVDSGSALELMLATTSVIKRPVLVGAGPVQVGFTPERYAALFKAAA